MTPCESIQATAAGLAALPPDDPERAAAWEHARSCPGCARVVRESERLKLLLAEVRPAPLPGPALDRVSRLVAELRGRERRRTAWSMAAAIAASLLLVALARERSSAANDGVVAAALAASAAGLVAAARRAPGAAFAAAVAASAAAAGLTGGPARAVDVAVGAHCLGLELVSAAAVMGAAWLAFRKDLAAASGSFVLGAAAAGALAADAALHLTCSAHASLPHLLAFHVGGVALAGLAAMPVWRLVARAAT